MPPTIEPKLPDLVKDIFDLRILEAQKRIMTMALTNDNLNHRHDDDHDNNLHHDHDDHQVSGLSMLLVAQISKLNLAAYPVWIVCLIVCFMTGGFIVIATSVVCYFHNFTFSLLV